jgi:hypothetical protein
MANIRINDVKPAGAELFSDYESFLHQLSDDETMGIIGGQLIALRDAKSNVISYIETNDIQK